MKIGERVIVDAAVTGDGVHHHGFIEEEIRDFYNKNKVHVWVDTRTHDMKDIEFDEYEEIK